MMFLEKHPNDLTYNFGKLFNRADNESFPKRKTFRRDFLHKKAKLGVKRQV
jgi:hypothetical protein